MVRITAGCVVVAVISLLGPSEPSYDPWAWLVWGREMTHLGLDTTFGPIVEAPAGGLHNPVRAVLRAARRTAPDMGGGFHNRPEVVSRPRWATSRPHTDHAHGL